MCKTCGCETSDKPVQYRCACEAESCDCDTIIEFDIKPTSDPYCCGVPMIRIK